MYRVFCATALTALLMGVMAPLSLNAQGQQSRRCEGGCQGSPTPPPEGGVTNDGLGEMLKKLGYEPERSEKDGQVSYLIRFNRDGWNHVCTLALVDNNKRLYLFTQLGKLPERQAPRADILEKILRKNQEIGPSHFVCTNDRCSAIARPLGQSQTDGGRIAPGD